MIGEDRVLNIFNRAFMKLQHMQDVLKKDLQTLRIDQVREIRSKNKMFLPIYTFVRGLKETFQDGRDFRTIAGMLSSLED